MLNGAVKARDLNLSLMQGSRADGNARYLERIETGSIKDTALEDHGRLTVSTSV